MSNKIFKEEIKKTTNRELDVPRAILFSLDTLNSKLTLELTLECLFANMQTDATCQRFQSGVRFHRLPGAVGT